MEERLMRIAIITLHRVYNYGSALQAFATQTVFERRGHEVKIIDYITPQRTKWKLFWGNGADDTAGLFYRLAKLGSIVLKELTFGAFVRSELKLTKKYITADDLEKDPPEADLYVTGSDQTWNSVYNEGVDRGFFLDFVPESARRISYVASFGKTRLDNEEIELTKKYLDRYEALSVREESAKDIISLLGRKDAIQLIDPTLMLSKAEWMTKASKRLVKERYLLLMLLYNEDNDATKYARYIADKLGLKLVKLSWELRKQEIIDQLFTHRTPADFLSLFNYADYIVTNSFHGLAFSINLEKEFIIVPRNEFNSRIESLLKLVDLQDRMVTNLDMVDQCIQTNIQYSVINRVIEKEREKTNRFLDGIEGL